jgi:hypothetical protein
VLVTCLQVTRTSETPLTFKQPDQLSSTSPRCALTGRSWKDQRASGPHGVRGNGTQMDFRKPVLAGTSIYITAEVESVDGRKVRLELGGAPAGSAKAGVGGRASTCACVNWQRSGNTPPRVRTANVQGLRAVATSGAGPCSAHVPSRGRAPRSTTAPQLQ